MAVIRGRIVLIDRNSAPSESSMKKRMLNHFIKYCGELYMSTIITLKDPKISLEATVLAIRASQAAYQELHPTLMIALVIHKPGNNPTPTKASPKRKNCAHCGRMGHLREECFIWLDTLDASKWGAKNSEKARKIRMMQEKVWQTGGKGPNKRRKNRIRQRPTTV